MNPSNTRTHDTPHHLLWPNWWQHHDPRDERDAQPRLWRALLAALGFGKIR